MDITIACATRVAFHLDSPKAEGLGGIETASIEFAKSLAARGHAVTLLTRTDQTRAAAGVKNMALEALPDLTGDVLIVASNAEWMRGSKHSRHVLWLHNHLALNKAARRGQIGPMLRHRPHAVFGSVAAERACSRLYPFVSRHIIPLGVSAEFLSSRLDAPRSLRFVWASNPRGELKPTVQAWLRAHAQIPTGASFDLFGVDEGSLGLSPAQAGKASIVLHPRLTKADLARSYESAAAMVCPGSPGETFCLAAAEAQCAGLPVITLGTGALAERVQHGVNGLVCRDMTELADAVVALARDAELLGLLREGAQRMRPVMGWDRVAKLWESFLTRL
ncbi:MAG: glycosyltransferase family 4 protein [Hyphomicrobiaceae bacterium]|nr:MAG: glycosyltransferase family 4 protein [Hyphomicrobiaceae bacterium]